MTARIASYRDAIRDLAEQIYADPELSGDERRARERCTAALDAAGFEVRPVPGVPTSFVAEASGTSPGRRVGLLAEYDALPGLGHACGHHLIAGAAVGAGLLASSWRTSFHGTLAVYGCPAEETLQGKTAMLEAGAFEGLDYALSFHAHDVTSTMRSSNGLTHLTFTFTGRPSHAGNEPWAGASALDGVLLTYQNVNALRQFVRDGVRMHGIVTRGGDAFNTVPETASCELAVRSVDPSELARVTERVVDCARAAALASGTELSIQQRPTIPPVRRDEELAARVRRALEARGHAVADWDVRSTTDFANVSQVVPSVLFSVATWPKGTAFHSHEATVEGGREPAYAAMLDAVLVMAEVSLDLLGVDPGATT